MNIPPVCFTCQKSTGTMQLEYNFRFEHGEHPKDIMDSLGLDRYCCRRMLLSYTNKYDELLGIPNTPIPVTRDKIDYNEEISEIKRKRNLDRQERKRKYKEWKQHKDE